MAQALEERVFTPPEGLTTTTNLSRVEIIVDILDEVVLPAYDTVPQFNLGVVGVGYDTMSLCCPYEPFLLGAKLEAEQTPYSMTLVDISQDVLADVSRRNHLFTVEKLLRMKPAEQAAWNLYLGRSLVDETVLMDWNDPEIVLSPFSTEQDMFDYWHPQERTGIRKAAVPDSFREARCQGRIHTIQGNIGDPRIGTRFPLQLHFISAMNVLYYLPDYEQRNALHTFHDVLAPGGFVLWNDKIKAKGTQLMQPPFGWLKPGGVRSFGFEEIPTYASQINSNLHLFRKTGEA